MLPRMMFIENSRYGDGHHRAANVAEDALRASEASLLEGPTAKPAPAVGGHRVLSGKVTVFRKVLQCLVLNPKMTHRSV